MGNLRLSLAFLLASVGIASPARAALPKVGIVVGASASTGDQVATKINDASVGKLQHINLSSEANPDVISATGTTPDLATLLAYDAIGVFSYSSFDDKDAMGDRLAEYLLSPNRGVVVFACETADSGSWGIGGEWAENYLMMTPQAESDFVEGAAYLDWSNIGVPNSPLLDGLSDVSLPESSFGCSSTSCWRLLVDGTHPLRAGTTVVASWDDGNPLIMTQAFSGHPVVELNFYPVPDTSSSHGWDPDTKGGELMRNAFLFVVGGPVKADFSKDFGTIGLHDESLPQTVSYLNTSTVNATITALVIEGDNAGDFHFTTPPTTPIIIGPGGTSNPISLYFQPLGTGARAGTLKASVTLATPEPTTLEVLTTLHGFSTGPEIVVTPATTAVQRLLIGGTPDGTPVEKEFTVTNAGGGTPEITVSVQTQADYGVYSIVGETEFSLASGASRQVSVRFTPDTGHPGNHDGVIRLTSPDIASPVDVYVRAGNGPPALTLGNGDLVVMPSQHPGRSSQPVHGFSLINSGFSTLTITGVAVDDDTYFGIQATLPLEIEPGASALYDVIFHPPQGASLGTKTTTVSVDGNGIATRSYTVQAAVVAYSTEFAVSPAEALSGTTIDFGSVLGGHSVTRQLVFTNKSEAVTWVTALGVEEGHGFRFSSPPVLPLAIPAKVPGGANGTLTIPVIFSPALGGQAEASLTYTLDDPAWQAKSYTLSGLGQAGNLAVDPTILDFGGVAVGTTSSKLAITMTNTGNAALSFTSLSIGGADSDVFDSTDMPSSYDLELQPGPQNAITFHITFSPTVGGIANAHVSIGTNDPVAPTMVIPLRGVGTQPGISIEPLTYDFGTTMVDVPTASAAFIISNTGDANLEIKTLATGDPQFAVTPAGPITIPPADIATVNVTFTPTVAAIAKTDLTITPASTQLQPILVHLQGTGISPALQVSPMALSWGIVTVGKAGETQIVTIKNTSDFRLTLGEIASSHPSYTVDSVATQMELDPQQETTFSVTFAPTAAGTVTAEVAIKMLGSSKATAKVSVTGEGIMPVEPKDGGCAVAGRTPSAAPLALVLLAGAGLVRRRRKTS